jgi:hypothetical protein
MPFLSRRWNQTLMSQGPADHNSPVGDFPYHCTFYLASDTYAQASEVDRTKGPMGGRKTLSIQDGAQNARKQLISHPVQIALFYPTLVQSGQLNSNTRQRALQPLKVAPTPTPHRSHGEYIDWSR